MGIEVLPPAVNRSVWPFSVDQGRIRMGLGAVKGIGEGAVEAILEARQRVGRFRTLVHLASEVDLRSVNAKVFEALVKSGAVDEFGESRAAMASALEKTLDYAQARRQEREAGQGALFGGSDTQESAFQVAGRDAREWPEVDRLAYEKEALGFYLSGNPLHEHQDQLVRLGVATTADLREGLVDGVVTVGGIVTRVKRVKIKSGANAGRMMGRFVLEDLQGAIPAALFAEAMQRFGSFLDDGALVIVKGSVRGGGSDMELSVDEVEPLSQATQKLISRVELRVERPLAKRDVLRLRDALVEHQGDIPVRLRLEIPGFSVQVDLEQRFRVRMAPLLAGAIEEILGPGTFHRSFDPVGPEVAA